MLENSSGRPLWGMSMAWGCMGPIWGRGDRTTYGYTPAGQVSALTDAENQVTTYTYNARGEKIRETYPDHVSGAAVGTAGYGIIEFSYDAAGRVRMKTDQQGDTCTFTYNLGGQLLSRAYRTRANSPSGTVADSDTFTYDRAGRMLTALSGRYANTVTLAYDHAGRLASEGLTIAGQTYRGREIGDWDRLCQAPSMPLPQLAQSVPVPVVRRRRR